MFRKLTIEIVKPQEGSTSVIEQRCLPLQDCGHLGGIHLDTTTPGADEAKITQTRSIS